MSSHKTMNYMSCKMANDWAKEQGADEAIIVNSDGSVCETATANILCTKNGKWYRPKSDHVLPGTMENAVCDLLALRGTKVEMRILSIGELKNADNIFVTNALMGIVPVLRIDKTTIGGDTAGLCAEINSILL
jgi:para-aminobenzoate synthetase component I